MADLPDTLAKPLTPKKARFVAAYLQHGNGSRAAAEAGYSAKSAKSTAYRLLNECPDVTEAVSSIRAEVRKKTAYSAERAMQECERGMDLAISQKQMMAYMRGVELRARLMGYLKDKVEVEVKVDIANVLAAARQRARIIDVTPAALPAAVVDPFE